MHLAKIGLAVALLLPGALQAQEPEPGPPRISVSASAVVEAEPDRAVLDLAVETAAPTAVEAVRQNAARMDALVSRLRHLGIPDRQVKTVGYTLRPEYRPPRPNEQNVTAEERIIGYRALNTVRVVVDSIPRVGAIIDAAVQQGGNRVANLSFELRDPVAARRQALRQATETATSEATTIAEALGGSLGDPIQASSSYSPPVPRPFAGAPSGLAVRAMESTTPVQGGTLEIRADVSVVFRLQRP